MNAQPRFLSVTDPISPAIDRVKDVLFRPFDLGRWFVVGFCAWLAMLGQGGGGGGGGNYGFGNRHGSHDFHRAIGEARDYVMSNLSWIIPLAAGLFALGLAVWVLITWLSSRGQFMFLHCVATNRAEVRAPWHTYRNQGNSLCLFRLVLGFVSLLLVAPAIVGTVALILTMVLREAFTWPLALGAAGALLAAIAFGTFFAIISKLTLDFVVPIMALRQVACRTAWGEFLRLTSGRRLHLVLYLLFQILLAMVVGAAVFAIIIATCCIAGCFLALPYLGTVLLLPVLVFDRAYSLAYLAQFGPEWTLIPPAQPV